MIRWLLVTATLARRELASLFCSAVAYAVLAVFALATSLLFLADFQPGAAASLTPLFESVVWLLVFLAPALSMRLLSEEYARGTVERLATWPVSEAQVVVAKWAATVAFLAVLGTPLLAHAGVLEWFADPDPGPLFTGLAGLLAVASLYAAIGLAASAATASQAVAFLVAVLVICLLTFGLYFLADAGFVPPAVGAVMRAGNVNARFSGFARGLVDLQDAAYFAAGTTLALFAAVRLLESRRWA
ncbi:ABC transporter permease [Phycisphaera mikurensis]|uniref:Putative ABC transporter permease protein n=1 Tax=Phycisphaera mikurensis (strain NBRC 102666 / KCTC 22515 / FYK2301M01) TaxID=1142394 RepID=I0IE54_PHYMF|nr:ABC transporter permease subunit [Phycisphaera mikurensis]MBB6441347.1 ABC-2 type transport system permease protein [Phycisphaera mikurensis]BAM03542.1 putative ABC transporter permease protein [Phycisphaera mikurensis NBRC 102666]